MNSFDVPTILLMTVLSSGMMAIVLLAAARSFPAGVQGIRYWALGSLCLMLGRLLIWLRTQHWPELFTVILANCLLFWGIGLWLVGTQAFYGRRPNWRSFNLIWACGLSALACFLWIKQDADVRVVVFSLIYSACDVYILSLILRHGERHFSTRFFALLMLVQAGVTAARAVIFMHIDVLGIADPANGKLNMVYLMLSNFMSLMAPVGFMTVATRRLQALLEQRSNLDPLTSALNRRGFVEHYEREVARMRRDQLPIALLCIDLDQFKSVNDRYGHGVGDRVLMHVTDIIVEAKRETDHVARFGGEEFVVLLPGTTSEAALVVAQRIQSLLREAPAGDLPVCTVSIGIASQELAEQNLDRLLKLSDAALYRAKANGRDRIELASQEMVGV